MNKRQYLKLQKLLAQLTEIRQASEGFAREQVYKAESMLHDAVCNIVPSK